MPKGHRHAQGKHAKAQCQKCGHVVKYTTLRRDGYIKNLLVCRDCYDPAHPQERVQELSDAVTLKNPAPLLDDVPEDTTLLVDVLEGGTTFGGET